VSKTDHSITVVQNRDPALAVPNHLKIDPARGEGDSDKEQDLKEKGEEKPGGIIGPIQGDSRRLERGGGNGTIGVQSANITDTSERRKKGGGENILKNEEKGGGSAPFFANLSLMQLPR
jgi:hypothetical protein